VNRPGENHRGALRVALQVAQLVDDLLAAVAEHDTMFDVEPRNAGERRLMSREHAAAVVGVDAVEEGVVGAREVDAPSPEDGR
jgi:hypothetical protein